MANNNPDAVYLKVDLNFNGVFGRHSYTGGDHFLFTDVDFAGMNLGECVMFLERFTGEVFEKMYYCLRTRPLSRGIRPLQNDLDYLQFLDTAYEDAENPISLYVDHSGDGLDEWFDSSDESGSVISGEEEEIGDGVEDKVPKKNDGEDIGVQTGLEDEIFPDEVIPLNKTSEDDFLTKLFPDEENNEEEIDEQHMTDNVEVHPTFNPNVHWKQQKPILGMRFENPKQLKNMLCNYAVANGYQICFKKNDTKRLLAMCCQGACTFRLWATWMSEEHSFQIKSLKDEHQCSRNFKLGSIVNYQWIGGHYTKQILHRQKLTIRQLRLEVIKKFGVDVSLGQCRRAKKYALSLIEGTLVEHYAKLWSYGAEILRSNPGSTVKMDVDCMPDGKNFFSKFYVCFDGVKKGWLEGCRRVIGLDGCVLKGICTGELLTAIGRDANNQIYPIAWAVVCVENKVNWKWFLNLLSDDLNLQLGQGVTLMSDQHKGLLEAVKELLPQAEHRQCAKHIVGNFIKRFSGAHYENLFWQACTSTTEQNFKVAMQELQALNPAAHKYLMDKDPKTWSLAYYQTGRCCEAVENGTSESFNAVIVEARKKPIITMLEELRLYMMEKLFNSKHKGWSSDVSPAIRKKLGVLRIDQRFWHVLPSGLNKFETRSGGEAFEVDLDAKTCSCRLWQINGYGCAHSVAAILFLNRDVEKYVDPLFCRDSYNKTYQYNISPMNGSKMWPETSYTPPLPPKNRRMPGRPATKRKRDASERQGKHKVCKRGKKVTCSICKEEGHNKKTCPTLIRPTKLKAKKAKVTHNTQAATVGVNASEEVDANANVQVEVNANAGGGSTSGTPSPRTRKRQSERIVKAKLSKNVIGKNGEGNSGSKPLVIE